MTILRNLFNKVSQAPSALSHVFLQNIYKIGSVSGIATGVCTLFNRSAAHGGIVIDLQTLSGCALLAGSLLLYPARKYPVLKRVYGGASATGVTLLIADAVGKEGFWGIVGGYALPMAKNLALIFEGDGKAKAIEPSVRKGFSRENLLGKLGEQVVDGFKRAPVFWTGMLSFATKAGVVWYAIQSKETPLFYAAVAVSSLKNICTAFSDNSIQHKYNVTKAKAPAVSIAAP